ncbi:hypothetical protein [Peribacillus sp. SCS-155]|uniref:hypothetical protein n=1 Tax=Peribacillus sedimenti TaxID=3115297 RepID=UPI003905B6BE
MQYIILGALQFVGFHLSSHLLEQGYEVLGFDWEKDTQLLEEKRLEIGRNANFTFSHVHEITKYAAHSKTNIIVCWYDIDKSPSSDISSIAKEINSWLFSLNSMPDQESPRVFFVGSLGTEKKLSDYEPYMQVLLPTIYGPWQHKSMVFQSGLQQKESGDIRDKVAREYKEDALYIRDFIEHFERISMLQQKNVIVQNARRGQWIECFKEVFHKAPPPFQNTPEPMIEGFLYEIENSITPNTGIALQRAHAKKIGLINE